MAVIQNKIILVFWLPGTGKSYFTSVIAWLYWIVEGMTNPSRIWSNIDVYGIKNGRPTKINRTIKKIEDLALIKKGDRKGLVIIDEGGLNMNSRKSMTKANLDFAELGILGRKLNVDIIVIAQLDFMIDKYFRKLASYTFEMDSYFVGKDKLMFKFRVVNRFGGVVVEKEIDMFRFSQITGMKYDTNETSKIDTKRLYKQTEDDEDGWGYARKKKARYLDDDD